MKAKARAWPRINLEIPPDLDDDLRVVARELGLSRNQLIVLWLGERLAKVPARALARAKKGHQDRTPAKVKVPAD